MRSSWIKYVVNPMTSVLTYKRQKQGRHAERLRRKGDGMMAAEPGMVMQLQKKEQHGCWQPLEARRDMEQILPGLSRRNQSC